MNVDTFEIEICCQMLPTLILELSRVKWVR